MIVNQESKRTGSPKRTAEAEKSVDLSQLDLAQLAWFVGNAANEHVRTRLEALGFGGLRVSHGYVVQHLLRGPQRIGELADLLEISQQAVSKSIAELSELGYVEDAPSTDRRVRLVRLSQRGKDAVRATRACRKKFEDEMRKLVGPRILGHARRALVHALEALGAEPAIRTRNVPYPR